MQTLVLTQEQVKQLDGNARARQDMVDAVDAAMSVVRDGETEPNRRAARVILRRAGVHANSTCGEWTYLAYMYALAEMTYDQPLTRAGTYAVLEELGRARRVLKPRED